MTGFILVLKISCSSQTSFNFWIYLTPLVSAQQALYLLRDQQEEAQAKRSGSCWCGEMVLFHLQSLGGVVYRVLLYPLIGSIYLSQRNSSIHKHQSLMFLRCPLNIK